MYLFIEKIVQMLQKEQNRIIDVKWYNDEKKSSYTVEIEIFANDRNGLLGDIVQKLNDSKVRLISVNAKATKERIAITEVTLEVDSVESLNKVKRELRKIDSVYEVSIKKNDIKGTKDRLMGWRCNKLLYCTRREIKRNNGNRSCRRC